MVGREAIHAALNPVAGNSLYFVARGDGSHVFSDDLDAHNSAVREFQLKRRADYRSSPAPVTAPEATNEQAPIPAASPDPAPEALAPVTPPEPAQETTQEPAKEPAAAPAPESDATAPQSPQ
jgi:UPF0755 protein